MTKKTLIVVATAAVTVLLFGGAAQSAPVPVAKQQMTQYFTAFAKTRAAHAAFRPQLNAAVADINHITNYLSHCQPETADALLKYAELMRVSRAAQQKLLTKAKLGKNYRSVVYANGYYSRASYGTEFYWRRLSGICDGMSEGASEANRSISWSALREFKRTSPQTQRELSVMLGEWRRFIIAAAKDVGAAVPKWVYTVGVS